MDESSDSDWLHRYGGRILLVLGIAVVPAAVLHPEVAAAHPFRCHGLTRSSRRAAGAFERRFEADFSRQGWDVHRQAQDLEADKP